MTENSELYLTAEVQNLKTTISELKEEQTEFMADYHAIIQSLRDRIHRLESQGCDE